MVRRGRVAGLVMLSACSDPNDEVRFTGEIAWDPCPLRAEGEGGPTAQCATVFRPIRPDDVDAGVIEVFAQRRITEGATRQLWMLAGGPGQSGAVYETYVEKLSAQIHDLDLYVLEHRGVGRSTRLGCVDEEAEGSDGGIDVTAEEWPVCLERVVAQWGDDLAVFTIDEAAHDLAAYVAETRGDQQVFVYGGSYGTTLAHRFLQHYPDVVDGVILDSIAVDVDHRVYDVEFDEVGRLFLAECGADERCTEALGDDPELTADQVIELVEGGHCSEVIDPTTMRRGLGAFLADASLRGFAPALIHRVGRCAEDDVVEIERLIDLFQNRPPHYTERLYSPVLFSHIELSEQWPEPWPTIEELEASESETVFSFGLGASQRPLLDTWPRYPLDPVAGQLAETATPMLMLQGGLDPQTPPWRTDALREHFDGPGQHFVEFPKGTHILLGATPAPGGDCATQLLAGFLDDPMSAPDTTCVPDVEPIDFDGQPVTSWLLFGDCSRYGNGCGGRAMIPVLAALALWGRRRAGARYTTA